MDKINRKDLKHDKFAEEVIHSVDFIADHRKQAIRYGSIALVVIVLGFGMFFYMRHQHTVREELLRDAMLTFDANISPNAPEGMKAFPTQDEKDKAMKKAFSNLADNYSGSMEGEIGRYFLGVNAADKGKLDEAGKYFEKVADSGQKDYGSLARLALAQIQVGQGKNADAEKTLRYVADHPTTLVSKEQAQIELAKVIAKRDPAEARKMLEPLRTDRTAISQAAVQTLAQISQK
ncbi:MAG: tetratricopeptide repeat protein [Bryobacteraceae bacterium]